MTDRGKHRHPAHGFRRERGLHIRAVIVYVLIIAGFSYLFVDLYRLASADSGQSAAVMDGQYSRTLQVVSRRGAIFDRDGEPLAEYQQGFAALADPGHLDRTPEQAAEYLAQFSQVTAGQLRSELEGGKPFTISLSQSFAGAQSTAPVWLHVYPAYVRYPDEKTLAASYNDAQYQPSYTAPNLLGYLDGDGQGVAGIERAYNSFLSEVGGSVSATFASDALGNSLPGVGVSFADHNYSQPSGLVLTIQKELQDRVQQIMSGMFTATLRDAAGKVTGYKDLPGAIVVMDADTGEVYASASSPTFDPNDVAAYLDSAGGELVDRTTASFVPGSVFKTVVACAALETDYAKYSDFHYTCTGSIDVDGKLFNCHKLSGHGDEDLVEALANSCNTYYMNLALDLGYDKIYAMAKKLGVGDGFYFDDLNSGSGNIAGNPDPVPAFVANAAIGQGSLLLTPYEMTRVMAAIVNGGTLVNPYVVSGELLSGAAQPIKHVLGESGALSARTCAMLRQGLALCVGWGTGTPAQPQQGLGAGKTASAESGQYDEQNNQIVHSWFCGYYPVAPADAGALRAHLAGTDQPVPGYDYIPASGTRFVITVFMDGGVTYSMNAAPVYAAVCDALRQLGLVKLVKVEAAGTAGATTVVAATK